MRLARISSPFEGLDDVVVGAGIETRDAVVGRVPRGDDHDRRCVAFEAACPNPGKGVPVRQPKVEKG